MFNTTYKVVKKRKRSGMKKRPAKRKNNPMVTKLLNLKYRINDAYRLIKNGQGKPKLDLTLLGDTRIDKQWLMTLISDVRSFGRTELCKEDMLKCNGLWRKYETN